MIEFEACCSRNGGAGEQEEGEWFVTIDEYL